MRIFGLALVLTLLGGSAALADDAATWIERSHDAVFDSSQTVTCATPDGQVDGVFTVAGTGGAIHAGQGAGTSAFGASGMFVASDGGPTVVDVPTGNDVVTPKYESVEIAAERFDGRRTKLFKLFRDDVLRATLEFDHATGALLSMSTFNADGSEYCLVETTSFSQPVGMVEPAEALPTEPTSRLDRIDAVASVAPSSVAGFTRLDTYRWREEGSATFYSDGLFSFTLMAQPLPFELDDSDASDVEFGEGTYRRLFEPGRSIYVWESEMGGMSIVGDLPLDLQEAVLGELAPSERPNLLTRIWRRLFR